MRELAALPRMVLLCGRYEGIDERFLEANVDEEISLGDYVLSGGELGAAVIIDAVARLQEGPSTMRSRRRRTASRATSACSTARITASRPSTRWETCRRCCARATTQPSPPGAASSRCSGLPSDARTCWMNRRWAGRPQTAGPGPPGAETQGQP